MIDLKFSGMCKDCVCADLEVICTELEDFQDDGIKKHWEVRCIHSTACNKMEDKTIKRLEERWGCVN